MDLLVAEAHLEVLLELSRARVPHGRLDRSQRVSLNRQPHERVDQRQLRVDVAQIVVGNRQGLELVETQNRLR